MWKRFGILAAVGLLALAALVSLGLGLRPATAAIPAANSVAAPPPPVRQNPYTDAWLAANHAKYDNIWTAEYESRLQAAAKSPLGGIFKAFVPAYGVDVRMSNGNVLGSNQNEFQIDVNPTNGLFAIGTSNDGGVAGVGIFRTSDGGATWTSADASAYGVQASCCDPGVAYGSDGKVYAIILDTSPAATYIIRSTDNGATWQGPSTVSTPDRPNIAVDPSNSNIVYVTYSDLPATNRIKGYKSTDGGVTWGASFFVGDTAPPAGYEQSSQPRVASNGWLYVGYQQYTNSTTGCSAGVQNVVARSTDGGTTFTWTTMPIIQGGACSGAQAGRGIFCVNSSGSSFRSRSHPIMGVSPTNPNHVYMVYSGGDLEPTNTYVCAGSTGNHSDTLFIRSTDGGATFTAPAKINTDPDGANKDQYYPWMSVLANGQIWVGWNDRRDDANDYLSKWYQSYSNDEGATWLNLAGVPGNDPVADVQTQPNTFIGDYHGLGGNSGTNAHVMGMWFDSRISASGDAYTDPQVPPLQGTPTPTVTGTPPSPTRTATRTVTPTATTTLQPTATPCSAPGVITNGGFETGSLTPWTVLGTNPAPVIATATPHSGTYDVLLGTLSGPEPLGDGSIYQTITVPASGGTLSYWWNGATTDSITFDWQDAYITDTSGTILTTIMHNCQSTSGWVNQTFNMSAYAGQTVRIEFLVHQDGFGDDTSMYVDDVALLTACTTGTPVSATNTPTPSGGTATATPTCAAGPGGWTAGPDLPTTLVRAVGVYFPADGNFYTVGGRTSDAAGSDFQHVLKYNPGSNSWTQMASTLPDNQMNNMACGVLTVSGTPYIYCVGGSAATQTTATARVFFYNPATDTATALTAADNWTGDTSGTVLPGGFAVANNKLYILGGFDINVASTNGIYAFDPTAAVGSKWTTSAATTPSGIMYAPTAYFPGTGLIYVLGASDYQGGTVVDTATSFSFNPATNTIGTIAAIPRATGETRALTLGSAIWVIGGGRVAPNPSTEIDIYTPASNTWSVGSPFTTARRNFPTDTDGSKVWLGGGYASDGVTALSSMEIFSPGVACASPTPIGPTVTPTNTVPPTVTQPAASPTGGVPTVTPSGATNTPVASATPPGPTSTPCSISFSDVHPSDYFYVPVTYLYCHGVISGYSDGTFRPFANTTRSQMVKIVVLGFQKPIHTPAGGNYTFTDVPPSNPFFPYVETAAALNIVGGYACGGNGEPCDPQNRNYFRPFANVTRGQLSKIDVVAAGWSLINPPTGSFEDVAPGSAFYQFVETAYCHNIISGYTCGGPGEPCDPGNRPYFRQGADATRGQIAKIVYLSITTASICSLPTPTPVP